MARSPRSDQMTTSGLAERGLMTTIQRAATATQADCRGPSKKDWGVGAGRWRLTQKIIPVGGPAHAKAVCLGASGIEGAR